MRGMMVYVSFPAGMKPSVSFGRPTSCPDSSDLGVGRRIPTGPKPLARSCGRAASTRPTSVYPGGYPVVSDSTYTSWKSSNCWRRLDRHKHLLFPALTPAICSPSRLSGWYSTINGFVFPTIKSEVVPDRPTVMSYSASTPGSAACTPPASFRPCPEPGAAP